MQNDEKRADTADEKREALFFESSGWRNIMDRTMNEKQLTGLLKYSEADICDFKERIYHLEEEGSKISFLKDILAMANTIRYKPAYIIVGIRQKMGVTSWLELTLISMKITLNLL